MYAPVLVTEPPGLVTTTSTKPAERTGVVTVTVVAVAATMDAAVPPNVTADVVAKLVPVMTTAVDPDAGPLVVLSEVTVGASVNVNAPVLVAVPPLIVVTTTLTNPAA